MTEAETIKAIKAELDRRMKVHHHYHPEDDWDSGYHSGAEFVCSDMVDFIEALK